MRSQEVRLLALESLPRLNTPPNRPDWAGYRIAHILADGMGFVNDFRGLVGKNLHSVAAKCIYRIEDSKMFGQVRPWFSLASRAHYRYSNRVIAPRLTRSQEHSDGVIYFTGKHPGC